MKLPRVMHVRGQHIKVSGALCYVSTGDAVPEKGEECPVVTELPDSLPSVAASFLSCSIRSQCLHQPRAKIDCSLCRIYATVSVLCNSLSCFI